MLDWLDRQTACWWRWWYLKLLRWGVPELNRIEDADDRYYTAMLHAITTTPQLRGWRSWALFVGVPLGTLVISGISAYLGFAIVSELGGAFDAAWVGATCGGVLGVLALFTCWVVWSLRRDRARINETLANLGHNICPGCGYDMSGHSVEGRRELCCPECGARVRAVRHEKG